MFQFINHNSFILFGLILVAIVAAILLRDGAKRSDWIILGSLIVVLAVTYFSVRPAQATSTEADLIQARIGAGTPVLLEVQSPY